MPIFAKQNKSEFTPAPQGLWPGVCCDVIDLGVVESQWGESHQVEIRWQLEDDDPKSEKPYMVRRRFRLSLHEKSNLRAVLESWRGRKFTAEEMDNEGRGFDIEKLLGANCQVQVIHNIKGEGQVYANVQAVVPAAKKAKKLSVRGEYVRVSEREKRAEMERNPDGHTDGNGYHASDEDIPF